MKKRTRGAPDISGSASPQRRVLLMLAWYRAEMHGGVTRFAMEHEWRLDDICATGQVIPHGWRGDGVIVKLSGDRKHPVDAYVAKLRVPVVDLGFFGRMIGAPALRIDNDRVGVLAAEHLWERGIRRFVWYPSIRHGAALERERSVRAEVTRLGGELTTFSTAAMPTPFLRNPLWLGRKLAGLRLPIGVITLDDQFATHVYDACGTVGLKIPDDVAVLGINDDPLVCTRVTPPLSSVRLDLGGWAYAGAAILQRMMDGERVARRDYLFAPDRVVARRSTDVLAVEHPEVAKAIRFIASNYRNPIGVADVTAATRLTRSGLKCAFSATLSRSISSEIRRTRLEHVKRLLRETNLTLDVVAEKAGLAGARQLHHVFKASQKCSPRQYRLAHQEPPDDRMLTPIE